MSEQNQDISHLRQRLAQSNIIVDATRRFTSTLDFDEIQQALFEAAFQVVGAQQIALHLINGIGLESYICYPLEGLRTETAVLPPEATAYSIREKGEMVVWHQDDDEQAAPPISVEGIDQFSSYLALPLKGADKIVGVIEAYNLLEPQNAAQQAALLVEIAGPAGLAIYNGMLFQEAQHEITERKRIELEIRQQERNLAKRATQLETVSRVSTYTSTILEPNKLLQEVVNLTKDQFELYHVHIYLVSEAGDNLELVVGSGDVGRQMVAQGRVIPIQQKQSLVAQVARSGEGLIENDILSSPAFLPHPLLPDTRSEAAVPVILAGQVIGVLDVQSDRVGTFNEQDIHIQTMLAAHIAVALENARSYEQTLTSLVETEALLDITKETSHMLELTSITDNVLDKVLTATDFDAGLITVVDAKTQKLEITSRRLPEPFWIVLQENGLDGTLCDLVYRRRESVVVVDMAADAPIDVTGLIDLGFKSYQGVPLESRGEVLGTLCLFNYQSLTSEKANTLFLEAVGRQVGIAIRNVTLLEQEQIALSEAQRSRQQAQEYLDMQHVLHEINIELFRIEDLDELYRTAIELAHTRLGFDRIGMFLLNESKDLLLGTYGIDIEGNIRNEQGPRFAIAQKGTIDTYAYSQTRLVVEEDIELWHEEQVVGRGWHIGAAMWTEDSPMGVIFADNLLAGRPLKPFEPELLFAYAGIVSNLIQRNRFETIITKRAAEMQTVAEVGTAAATILETDELLQGVVDLTKNNFGLYHAHIYLLNKETETLVLTSGAGMVGQQMVAEGRQIPLKQEQSLVARAARSRQGVIVNDVQSEPGFLPHPLLPDTRAEMAVPLITGQQVLGVLDVQSDQLNYFTQEDINTFTTLAAQTAVALQNAGLFTQSEEHVKELALINRIVTQMNTIQDVKISMQFLVEELGRATGAGSAVINFINATGTAQEVVAAYLQEGMPDPVGTVMPIEGDPMMTRLLGSRQTLVVDDVANAPFPPEIRDVILQSGFRSLYTIPMFMGSDLIGSATISVLQGEEPLTPDQIRLAETLVFQATSVVQSTRLHVQTEQRAEELAFVNRIVAEINALDMKTGLQFMAEELGKILQIPSIVIGLIDGPGTMLEMVAAHHPASVPSPVGTVFPVAGDPIMSQALQTRQIVIVEDVANSNLPSQAREVVLKSGTRSMYVVPMIAGRDLIGTVSLNVMEGGSLLTPNQLKLAETTVYQTATAVQTARQYDEIQRSQESLRQSEGELSEALKIAKLAYWEYDVENDLFAFNDQFYALFHTTAEEHGGYQLSSAYYAERFVHPDDLPMVGGEIEQALNSTDRLYSRSLEHRILYADGGVGHISVNINVERDEQGKIQRYYGANQDITERKRAEEALKEEQERTTIILESLTTPLVITRVADGVVTYLNQPIADLMGVSREETIGRVAPDFYHDPADRQVFLETIRASGRVDNFELRMKRDDGEPFWALLSARFLMMDGEPAVVSSIVDITERMETGQALERQANELAAVAEVSTAAAQTHETDELLQTVVDLTKIRFDLYHSHVYLLNAKGDTLTMVVGAGEVGRELVAQGHQIDLSATQSLVAQAARTQEAVVVNDVHSDPNWLPNDLLPDTQSEVAVPLVVGGQVLGVLDVQSNEVDHFTEQNIQIQMTLAAQTAVALQNVRSFEQAQTALAEARRSQESLRQSEGELSEALKIAKLAYWEYDVENDLFALNDQFYALFHTTAEEHGGYDIPSAYYAEHFVHPDDLPIVGTEIEQALNSTERHYSRSLEHRMLYADGGIGHISVNINVERDEQGKILRYYGANQDITERKQFEEALQKEQERAQTILESINVPFAITKMSDGKVIYCNEALGDLVGVPHEELVGQGMPDFYANPSDREAYISQLREQGFVSNFDLHMKRGNSDELYWSLLSGRLIEFQDEPAIMTFALDITERRKAQALVAQRATELQTVAELGNIATTILAPDELLQQVVDLTKERFELYHAHIYLMGKNQEVLTLTSGAGETGRAMVAEGRRISLNQEQSLVARAARSRQGVVINDVKSEPGFLSHPLLPETRAEMAVPMMVGDRVVGVLDVQSEHVNRFTDQDVQIQTTLAAQVSIALENARSFEQAQTAVAEMNELTRRLTREGWQEYLQQKVDEKLGFVYDASELDSVKPVNGSIQANGGDSGVPKGFTQPINIRGEAIGQVVVVPQDDDEEIDPELTEILDSITEQLGAHIDNLRLADETRTALSESERQSEELASINRVVTEISTSLNLQESLEIIARELANVISVSHVGIALMAADQSYLEVITEFPLPERGSSEDVIGQKLPIKGYPLTEKALETRKYVIAYDAQNNPLTAPIHDILRLRNIEAIAVMPMVIGDEIFGTIAFDVTDPHRVFADSEMRLVETIVHHTTTAVQNSKLFDQTEQALKETEEQARRLAQLNQLSAAMNQALSLKDIYENAVEETPAVVPTDHVSLALLDDAGECFEILATWGEEIDLPVGTKLPAANTPLLTAMQEGRIITDTTDDAIKLAMSVPLFVSGQAVGTLSIGRFEGKPFSKQEENLMLQVATMVGTNIENMRFLANEQSRAQREQMLRQITQRIRSSADMETIMRTAVQEIGRTLGRKTYIYLGDDGEA